MWFHPPPPITPLLAPSPRPTIVEPWLFSDPAAGQLIEHLLVEGLVLVLGARGQEDVAADELVDDLAVHLGADERQGRLVGKFHRHLSTQSGDASRQSCFDSKRRNTIMFCTCGGLLISGNVPNTD